MAIIDLPPNVFAEAGVSPTIIFAYKPNKKELNKLIKNDYEVFSKEIKKVGYEVKTKNKVKVFEPKYKIPNNNMKIVMEYVETLTKAIINKEILIKSLYEKAIDLIRNQILNNQNHEIRC